MFIRMLSFHLITLLFPPTTLCPTEMHHQQHASPGGAVRGQALTGLVPPTGAAGHGHQPPLQVPHIQWDAALRDSSRRGTAD